MARMARYTLINPTTGTTQEMGEFELPWSLRPNCILIRGHKHLGIVTHRDLVLFTRWYAGQARARYKYPPEAALAALGLVDRWLEDEGSVTPEELVLAAEEASVDDTAIATACAAVARTAIGADEAAFWTSWAAGQSSKAIEKAWVTDMEVSYKSPIEWLLEHLESGK